MRRGLRRIAGPRRSGQPTGLSELGLCALAALLSGACSPTIGSSCSTRLDCSVSGDRACDTTVPGGYCTIVSCEPDTCPDDATCVQWRPTPARLSFTACMKSCGGDGDCRVDDGFRCRDTLRSGEAPAPGDAAGAEGRLSSDVAVTLDARRSTRVCVATRRP